MAWLNHCLLDFQPVKDIWFNPIGIFFLFVVIMNKLTCGALCQHRPAFPQNHGGQVDLLDGVAATCTSVLEETALLLPGVAEPGAPPATRDGGSLIPISLGRLCLLIL